MFLSWSLVSPTKRVPQSRIRRFPLRLALIGPLIPSDVPYRALLPGLCPAQISPLLSFISILSPFTVPSYSGITTNINATARTGDTDGAVYSLTAVVYRVVSAKGEQTTQKRIGAVKNKVGRNLSTSERRHRVNERGPNSSHLCSPNTLTRYTRI